MKYVVLTICCLSIFSCSRKNDATLFKEGKEAEVQKNFLVAAERYEEIVDRFPAEAFAESSLSRLAVMYTNDAKDSRKAIRTYQRYYTMFPNSKQAPTMLFLSGFMFNNDLHELDSARVAYQTFLQKYPHHELVPSATYELETLGKDPGQALQQRVTTTDEANPKAAKQ
jgi:outer membrane protein assembly factor BamD (BamD/ComL family)